MSQNKPSNNPAVRSALSRAGHVFVTVIMVGVITACIVASVLTVYVLRSLGAEQAINLDDIRLGYTSIMYYYDANGNPQEYHRLSTVDNNRIWVDLDEITLDTQNALIAIEDKRFYDHQGVDWLRTAGAFVNQFVPIYSSNAGGSTVHQQLIKNMTGDNAFRIDRKVREIFRAIHLAQNYTHEQVLETYLNVVPFGAGTNGIEAAANTYFGKSASELSLAESAAIIGITQKPYYYNPFINPEANKSRQEWILFQMLDQKYITQAAYDEALEEELVFKQEEHIESQSVTLNYFVDHVIESVIKDLMVKRGIDRAEATRELYQGGYRIYITMDKTMQDHLEKIYSTSENFPSIFNAEYPESAAVITDHHGKILAMVGGIGEKSSSRIFNRATMARRHPGSSIKPIGPYAVAFEYNRLTWSTLIDDYPLNPDAPPSQWYPTNYYNRYDRMMTVDTAIRRSVNTVAMKVAQLVTPEAIFSFLQNDLGFASLYDNVVIGNRVYTDVALAPMALGSMTEGVTPLEMVGGYQIIANGGEFTKPYAYLRVEDADGRVILEPDTSSRQVIGRDTATILNKLLQNVVNADGGTGRAAAISNMPTAGKTGTSTDDVDQWFIGMTPYYVCGVWMGYDTPITYDRNGDEVKNQIRYPSYPPPILFQSIMAPLHANLPYASFYESADVVSMTYCTESGLIAGPNCAAVASGWYKKSNLPKTCNGIHATAIIDDEDQADRSSYGSGGTAIRPIMLEDE